MVRLSTLPSPGPSIPASFSDDDGATFAGTLSQYSSAATLVPGGNISLRNALLAREGSNETYRQRRRRYYPSSAMQVLGRASTSIENIASRLVGNPPKNIDASTVINSFFGDERCVRLNWGQIDQRGRRIPPTTYDVRYDWTRFPEKIGIDPNKINENAAYRLDDIIQDIHDFLMKCWTQQERIGIARWKREYGVENRTGYSLARFGGTLDTVDTLTIAQSDRDFVRILWKLSKLKDEFPLPEIESNQ